MRIVVAIRAFFAVLFDARVAAAVEPVLQGTADKEPVPPAVEAPVPRAAPSRSEAISLLEALQREARFVDIVKEPLGEYQDAQIGAAARDVLRDCLTVLDRFFGLEPLADEDEGADCEAPLEVDLGRYRLTGDVTGEPPFRGKIAHRGWKATRCELPTWSGRSQSTMVVAPIELEIG